MQVPMFNLKITDKKFKKVIFSKFDKFLNKGYFFMGDSVSEFEKITKNFLKSKYALGVSSGSSALYLSLKSQGIKKGDEVMTTPLTWIITVNAIAACGAIPVFADVNNDFNIDPKSIEKKITTKTKAILPMHYAGKMCDMFLISKIAKKYNLKIIEDCAQSYYAKLNGRNAGSFSNAASFSMNPMKPFGGIGEAGLITTNNYKTYLFLKKLRHAGTSSDPKRKITNNCISVSLNHKIDEVNAFMLVLLHNKLKRKIQRCNEIANYYEKNLSKEILHQTIDKNEIHGRYVYPIICKNRDKLRNFLIDNKIETKIFNKPLCYNAPVYKKFKKEKLQNAEKLIKNHLIIPCHENLSNNQVEFVIKKINYFFKSK